MGFNKSGIHRRYKYEIITHPTFGEIRTAIIKGKRYYSSKDIGDLLGVEASSSGASRYLRDGRPAQYITYRQLDSGRISYLRVIQIDEVLLLISRYQHTKRARKLLEWILSSISDQFNYDL